MCLDKQDMDRTGRRMCNIGKRLDSYYMFVYLCEMSSNKKLKSTFLPLGYRTGEERTVCYVGQAG